MKYFFIPLLLFLIAAFVTYLISISVKNSHAKNEASQILWYGKDREYYVYEMIASAFPRKNVFRNLNIPIRVQNNTYFSEIDIVIVTHAGVVVIEVKGMKGKIDNPAQGPWQQIYRDKILNFENPFEQNDTHCKAIRALLKKQGILNVPVYNVVVFADKNVSFTHKYKMLFKAEAIVDFIAYLNDKFTLSGKDIKNIDSVLSHFQKKQRKMLYEKKQKESNGK